MFPYLTITQNHMISTYGLMLAISFLTGRFLYLKRLQTINASSINFDLYILALVVSAVISSKLLFVVKYIDYYPYQYLTDFSQGYSSQGALLGAILTAFIFSKINKINLSVLLDNAAPAVIICYAIARIGCFLAGDNCYGIKTDLPWGMSFPNGMEPTKENVHPLPLYEIAYSVIIYFYLNRLTFKEQKHYFIFFNLLFLWGICRFLVEFLSINPKQILFMSGSQFGALIMILISSHFLFITGKKKPE
ncbi:MAG: prolipoprotein diacylglyceryl transferase [Gammaproteobacteria bacterium]|nr:prolipoprotein diacylglyceryl transferase [Gammaproteobacteria bacterium]MDH5628798.1 prolipoprotein diacylglyceryl transferase [Gammaproteobacteria bacterium]